MTDRVRLHPDGTVERLRVPCLVPFCKRTRKRYPDARDEHICSEHWRSIPIRWRQAFKRAWHRADAAWGKRIVVAVGEPWPTDRGRLVGLRMGGEWWLWPDDGSWTECDRAVAAVERLWRRMKREAIEVAAGINGRR